MQNSAEATRTPECLTGYLKGAAAPPAVMGNTQNSSSQPPACPNTGLPTLGLSYQQTKSYYILRTELRRHGERCLIPARPGSHRAGSACRAQGRGLHCFCGPTLVHIHKEFQVKEWPEVEHTDHLVGTVTSNLPVNMNCLSRLGSCHALQTTKTPVIHEVWDFSAFPKGGILLCWGLILAEGKSGEKVIEVWKLTNGCFVQKRNNFCYTVRLLLTRFCGRSVYHMPLGRMERFYMLLLMCLHAPWYSCVKHSSLTGVIQCHVPCHISWMPQVTDTIWGLPSGILVDQNPDTVSNCRASAGQLHAQVHRDVI